jgi:hypothetical protein
LIDQSSTEALLAAYHLHSNQSQQVLPRSSSAMNMDAQRKATEQLAALQTAKDTCSMTIQALWTPNGSRVIQSTTRTPRVSQTLVSRPYFQPVLTTRCLIAPVIATISG